MTSALWPRVPSTQLEPTSPSFPVAASTQTSVAPCAAGSASSMRSSFGAHPFDAHRIAGGVGGATVGGGM